MASMIQKIMCEEYKQQLRVSELDEEHYADLTNEELTELERLMKRRFVLSPVKQWAKQYGFHNLVIKGFVSSCENSPVRVTKREADILHYLQSVHQHQIYLFYRVEGE